MHYYKQILLQDREIFIKRLVKVGVRIESFRMRYSRLPVRLCYFNNSVASDRLLCAFVPFFLHSYPMGVIIGLISYHEGLKEITHRKDLTQYPVHY